MKTDLHIIYEIIEREGSTYTNKPHDKGGPTKYGITQNTLGEYRGKPVSPAEVAALTQQEAVDCYKFLYIKKPKFDRIRDDNLRGLIVDCGVLHGQSRAAKWLQAAIGGLKVDGDLGDKSISALNASDIKQVFMEVCGIRVRFMGRIVVADYYLARKRKQCSVQLQADFLNGWLNRATDFFSNIKIN